MSIIETTLIFAGIPAAVIVLIAGAVYAGGSRRSRRYRPGRPFDFTPVWFLSAPEQLTSTQPALKGATGMALPSGVTEWSGERTTEPQSTGGASDRW